LGIVSPYGLSIPQAVGHTRALAKQWRQTVRIETNSAGAGPDFFFFLSGLALLMVWLTQQLYL
jgi:hypothetical protein